ncbi:MAG: ABC transporter permease [Kiritimatiellaeota bacterium]|nr:ABC transporter permease [Kiritimatiellota bacterium]
MKAFFTLWRRELGAYFLSPIAYVMMIFFLLIMGCGFAILATALAGAGSAGAPVMGLLFDSFFFWMPTLMLAPLLTMRLLAEEKRSGTIETLMTAPVTDPAVVLAKYAGALSFYGVIWAPTAAYVIILRVFSPATPLDLGPIAGGYLGALLIGGFYLAIGLFCSALTRNQIVAAIICFALVCVAFFSGFLGFILRDGAARNVVQYFSSLAHMRDFARGVVDTRPIVFYLTGTALMLFATVKVVEARKWK